RDSREIADTLERIATAFSREWDRHRIIFVGYSFGADVGPSAFLQSEMLRNQIQTAIFHSPSHHVYRASTPLSWLGLGRGHANIRALQTLSGPDLICVRGEDDAKSACDDAARPDMTAITLPSGHTLHGDGAQIADIILSAAQTDQVAAR